MMPQLHRVGARMGVLGDVDADGLLDAIRECPGDDLPRLAFADWLEDGGRSEWAGFIRANVRLRRAPGPASLAAMLATGEAWREAVAGVPCFLCPNWEWEGRVPGGVLGVRFDRGFVWEVVCDRAAWLDHGPALCRLHPVASVKLLDVRPGDSADFPGEWLFYRNSNMHWISHLPPELFDELAGWSSGYPEGGDLKCVLRYYPSPGAALAELSDACVRWACGAAGVRVPGGVRMRVSPAEV